MKHIYETWAFLVKSASLRISVYNVYGSQNEFVERVTRVFILHMRSLGQNRLLWRNTVFAVVGIKTTCSLCKGSCPSFAKIVNRRVFNPNQAGLFWLFCGRGGGGCPPPSDLGRGATKFFVIWPCRDEESREISILKIKAVSNYANLC